MSTGGASVLDAGSVLDALPDGIIVFASDWRVLMVNRVAEMLLAVPRRDVVGKVLGRDLLFLDDARLAIYRRVMAHRRPSAVPGVRFVEAGARTRAFEGAAYPAAFGGIVVVFRDVTMPAHAEVGSEATDAALARRLEQAETERDALGAQHAATMELLATLSHDMRTPLNAILGYAELLELKAQAPVSDAQRGYLERVRTSARHLLDLVEAVLGLARVEAGEHADASGRALVGDALRVSLALVHPQAVARGIAIVDRSVDQPPVRYVGNVTQMRQILINLLSNAVKFAPAGGQIEVACWTAQRGAPGTRLPGRGPWACIRVRNTGDGIPPEEVERIFEPFVQLPEAGGHRGDGAGLGLAISRRLARQMGGDVIVQSRPGEGAAFTVWVPSVAAEQSEASD